MANLKTHCKAHQRQSAANKTRRTVYRQNETREVNAIIKTLKALINNRYDNDALFSLRKYGVTAKAKARNKFVSMFKETEFVLRVIAGEALKVAAGPFFDAMFANSNEAAKPKAEFPKMEAPVKVNNWHDGRKDIVAERELAEHERDGKHWRNDFSMGQRATISRRIAHMKTENTVNIVAKGKGKYPINVTVRDVPSDSYTGSRIFNGLMRGTDTPRDYGVTWEQCYALVGTPENLKRAIAAAA